MIEEVYWRFERYRYIRAAVRLDALDADAELQRC
jgi:hypothetical protein